MGSFQAGLQELEDRVGHGKLVGILKVDQVYAGVQHVGFWLTGPNAGVIIKNHPKGGQAHYLSEPLLQNAERYFRRLAFEPFEPGGLKLAMIDNVEDLSRQVYDKAPREDDVLRNSGHPIVEDNGEIVYDRPPVEPRRSQAHAGSHFNPSGSLKRRRR